MSSTTRETNRETLEKVRAFVIQQIKEGADQATAAHQLTTMGVEREAATRLVEAIYPHVLQTAKAEQLSPAALLPAAVGGLLAAVLGGTVWGGLVVWTGYEIGYVAWGVGVVSGMAVVLFAGGRKGMPLQALAVVSSLLGIAIGKYVTFYHLLKEQVSDEFGVEAAQLISIASSPVLSFFGENFSVLLGGFDILWVLLAVMTAWHIPKGMGITLPAHMS